MASGAATEVVFIQSWVQERLRRWRYGGPGLGGGIGHVERVTEEWEFGLSAHHRRRGHQRACRSISRTARLA
jgi:hypothetical protein